MVIGRAVDYRKMLEKELVVLAILLSCLLVLQQITEAIMIRDGYYSHKLRIQLVENGPEEMEDKGNFG